MTFSNSTTKKFSRYGSSRLKYEKFYLTGLEKVFTDEFVNAEAQRFQVHLARNAPTKCSAKIEEDALDDLRLNFYASTKVKAMKFYKEFEERWSKEALSAFKSLDQKIESVLRFYNYPAEEWLSLRTTNPFERLNKESKRRTKSMEIVAESIHGIN